MTGVQINQVVQIEKGNHSNGIGNPKQMKDQQKRDKVHINGSKFTNRKN